MTNGRIRCESYFFLILWRCLILENDTLWSSSKDTRNWFLPTKITAKTIKCVSLCVCVCVCEREREYQDTYKQQRRRFKHTHQNKDIKWYVRQEGPGFFCCLERAPTMLQKLFHVWFKRKMLNFNATVCTLLSTSTLFSCHRMQCRLFPGIIIWNVSTIMTATGTEGSLSSILWFMQDAKCFKQTINTFSEQEKIRPFEFWLDFCCHKNINW